MKRIKKALILEAEKFVAWVIASVCAILIGIFGFANLVDNPISAVSVASSAFCIGLGIALVVLYSKAIKKNCEA